MPVYTKACAHRNTQSSDVHNEYVVDILSLHNSIWVINVKKLQHIHI